MWLFSALIDPLKYSFFPNTLPPPLWFNFLGEKGPMNNAYPGCDGDLKRTVGLLKSRLEFKTHLVVLQNPIETGQQKSCYCGGADNVIS